MFYCSDDTLAGGRRFMMADERGSIFGNTVGDKVMRTVIPILIASLTVMSCEKKNEAAGDIYYQTSYSLCPISEHSRRELNDLVYKFAAQEGARVVDRGVQVQRDLTGTTVGKRVLESTSGMLVVQLVEKPHEFRIAITNLELTEKFALTFTSFHEARKQSSIDAFMRELRLNWVITEVSGGVTNDPPC